MLLLTLIIGAIVGLVVVAFILLTQNLGSRLYPEHSPFWRRLVIPLAGALGTGYLLARYAPNARGGGIPQTKIALFIRDGFIAFRTVIGKFTLSAVALASGIALGWEAPSIQVAAGIASVLGRKLGLSKSSIKALVPVGASAALAAAFNTPIAAVLFTMEEIMGDMQAPVLGSIVLAAATSWMVLHLLLGDAPLFHVPAYQLVNPLEFLVYAVLGLVGGVVSAGFLRLLLWERKNILKMPRSTIWWQPAIGGLLVGVLGLFVPTVLGVGYNFVDLALNGQFTIRLMALLVLLKSVSTATCYASGNAGGVLGPSLFIGAMLGGAVGGGAHMLFPDSTGSAGAYALVGMGVAFAGMIRLPLTSVIMIFEITRDYSIIVPLMISNLISYLVSSRLQEVPLYESLLHQDGIHLPSGARPREATLMVGQAMQTSPEILWADKRIADAVATLKRDTSAWPVLDHDGLRGIVTLDHLQQAIEEGRGALTVGELMPVPAMDMLAADHFPHVHADHTLDFTARRLAETGLKILPVVSRTNIREMQGTISMDGIVAAYATGKVEPEEEPLLREGKSATLLAGILSVLLGLAVVGGFLGYYFRSERAGRAERSYERGNALVKEDLYPEAVEQYRNALSLSHSIQYREALAMTLVKAGSYKEASIYLKELLSSQPASAPANLGMARVAVGEGRIDDALAYYHHAIYGVWPTDAAQNRLAARIELIQALGKAGRRQQAQAELLSLVAAMPGDLTVKKEVLPLLLEYGLPKEAADLARDVTARDPRDAEAFGELGQSQYALANYPAARSALLVALRLNPNDTTVQKLLDSCNQILSLDPTQRGVPVMERYRRSQDLLAKVLEVVGACKLADLTDTVQAAGKSVARRERPRSYSDATDTNMSMAEQLWQAAEKSCTLPPADAPLSKVMGRLFAR